MTREEAIAVLEKEASIIDDNSIEMTVREWDEFDDLKRDAIHVAIEALREISILAKPSNTVEVVRCGECRHKYMKDFDMFCPYMFGILKPNMHCSYGESEGE